jgi:hypothetical protein
MTRVGLLEACLPRSALVATALSLIEPSAAAAAAAAAPDASSFFPGLANGLCCARGEGPLPAGWLACAVACAF